LAKHLQTTNAIRDDIDLISFRGEKPPQNLPQRAIVLDDQNPIHWSRRSSEIGMFKVAAKVAVAISWLFLFSAGSLLLTPR
jgi:hypothetical protein